jgi:glycosyltransferase involved in cell wall biosynthesis
MIEIEPEVAPRSTTIHYGVPCPATLPARSTDEGRLRIVYAGRFVQEQKRVSDLPRIAHLLADCGIAAAWTLIGDGPEAAALRAGLRDLPDHSSVTFTGRLGADAVLEHYTRNDVLILTSDYEGLPLSLLEAMARGCIPVVTAVESGIPEVVEAGVNGFAVPVGDIEGFAARLAELAGDPVRRQAMHLAAFRTIQAGPFSIEQATGAYASLFERVRDDIESGRYRRPKPYRPGSLTGDVLPPPSLQLAPDLYFRLKGRYESLERMLGPLKTPVRALVRAYYRRMTSKKQRRRTPAAAPAER